MMHTYKSFLVALIITVLISCGEEESEPDYGYDLAELYADCQELDVTRDTFYLGILRATINDTIYRNFANTMDLNLLGILKLEGDQYDMLIIADYVTGAGDSIDYYYHNAGGFTEVLDTIRYNTNIDPKYLPGTFRRYGQFEFIDTVPPIHNFIADYTKFCKEETSLVLDFTIDSTVFHALWHIRN